jgi:aquaporin Z
MEKKLLKACIAECLGTFVLVFFACGVAALTQGSLVATAMAFGLVIVAMAYTVGRISGCHINPAVSLGCLLAKRMSVKEFVAYVCAQIVGGLLGAVLLFGILKMSGHEFVYNITVETVGSVKAIGNASNGLVGVGEKFGNYLAAILVEVVLTFVFVYVILNVTDGKNEGVGKKAGVLIGFTLTLVHLLGIGLTGTSVNPARSIGTAVGTALFGGGTEPLKVVWIFIVAPLLGAALAALVFKLLHKEEK